MSRTTLILIPSDASKVKQYRVSNGLVRFWYVGLLFLAVGVGYVALDYYELKKIRKSYYSMRKENKNLKAEANALMADLDGVKGSLQRVEGYTAKLNQMMTQRVKEVSKKTGIRSLAFDVLPPSVLPQGGPELDPGLPSEDMLNRMTFRPVFKQLSSLKSRANQQTFELKKLVAGLGQKASLLKMIPTILPVKGWISSPFGRRVSPFTGKSSMHRGMDVAARIGTFVHAPADGVVIFAGKKSGFGNFVMIAHGHGIVTRYGHNAEIMVQNGQKVRRGEKIATVGMTGRSTGPHLHYEVWVHGRAVDPKRFIL